MQILSFQVGEFRCLSGLGRVLLGVLVFVYCKYKRGSWLARKNRTRPDYYAVTTGFPLVSAPVAESEFYYFKRANASASMFHDKVKWPIYNKDIPFTWKKGTGKCDVKETMST